jgi:hypothetical protein
MKDSLPALLREIAEVVEAATGDARQGLAAALAIAEARGGQRVYMPAQLAEDHWLVATVGPDAAQALARHFPKGVGLDLPFGPAGSYAAERRRRARLYRDALSGNLSANDAARMVGVTRRAIFDARRRMKDGDGQPGLFDDEPLKGA